MKIPLTPAGSRKLRTLIRQRCAWPGGYEFVFYTRDGDILCSECARSNYPLIARERRTGWDSGWLVECVETAEYLEESCPCDHCHKELCPYATSELE